MARASFPRLKPAPLALAVSLALASLASRGWAQSPAPGTSFLPGTVVGNQVWSGASVPNFAPGSNVLEILQTQPRAQVYWNRFNIDHGQTVRFNQQGNRDWIALNWIADQSPTQIAGRLTADGQVYLINQNGIVFKPGSEVNAASFIASTLSINSQAFLRSLVALRDGTATFSADGGSTTGRIEVQQGTVTRLDGSVVPGPNGQPLQAMGTITSAEGGRVFLLAAQEVVNNGKIQSSGGQVVLAAGTSVFLFAPASTDDASFRGLYVEVNSGGSARNLGQILTERGNTSLIGLAVNNEGRISADSAVSGNGSVWLLARSGLPATFNATTGRPLPANTGSVVLGASSRIELNPIEVKQPDGSIQTALDSQTVFGGQVRIDGRTVHLQGNGQGSGAQIVAPGGEVTIRALNSASAAAGTSSGLATGPGNETAGPIRILADAGTRVDVSGLKDVSLPVDRNIIPITLLGDVVSDSPVLRNSPIAGQVINVDIRTGTPLLSQAALNAQIAANVRRGMLERSATAGTYRLLSEGDVVIAQGAQVDVSGGSIRYEPGRLTTSRVFDGSRVFDVGSAPTDRSYVAVDELRTVDPRWGVTQVYRFGGQGRFDPGYLEGKPSGWLDVNTQFAYLGWNITGAPILGPFQREAPPEGARLTLGDRFGYLAPNPNLPPDLRLNAPVQFTEAALAALPTGFDLTTPRTAFTGTGSIANPTTLSPIALSRSGVSRVEIFSNEEVNIDAPISFAAGGRLTVGADQVAVNAPVSIASARGGEVFRGLGLDGVTYADGVTSRGIELTSYVGPVRVSTGQRLDASGQWTVDPLASNLLVGASASMINGGTILLRSLKGIELAQASLLNVDAGGRRTQAGSLVGGAGGAINLNLTFAGDSSFAATGSLTLDGQMRGYGFARGGSLAITAPSATLVSTPTAGSNLQFGRDLFTDFGFASVDITGRDGLLITPGLQIQARQRNFEFQALSTTSAASIQTPVQLQSVVQVATRADDQRAPMQIALRASSRYRGDLEFGSGASINTDPKGTVTIEAGETLAFDGAISAPSGSVQMQLGRDSYSGFRANQNLWIGPNASIDVSSSAVQAQTARGLLTTSVADAGSIVVSANEGALLVSQGAQLLARGIAGTYNLTTSLSSTTAGIRTQFYASNGGQVTLRALSGGSLAGTVNVSAASPTAAGGSVTVAAVANPASLTADPPIGATTPPVTEQIVRVQDSVTGSFTMRQSTPITDPNVIDVATSVLGSGAANKVRLEARNVVELASASPIEALRSVEIDAQAVRVAPGVVASARAPFIQVGNSRITDQSPFAAPVPAVSGGNGRLTLTSTLATDFVGTWVTQGMDRLDVVSQGELRLRGNFDSTVQGPEYFEGSLTVQGALNLTGSQLYPTSLTRYALSATGPSSAIRVQGVGAVPGAPLSAGGALSLSAQDIAISGVVRAPLGSIRAEATGRLDIAAGAVVSASAEGTQIPFGTTQDQRSLLYPFSSAVSRLVSELPKAISLQGRDTLIDPAARIDASGGGDILASAFVSRGGIGNSGDILARSNVFAIVPGFGATAPYDPQIIAAMREARGESGGSASGTHRGALPSNIAVAPASSVQIGDAIRLEADGILPAGTYTLLPARYALLPGAFAVALTQGRADATAVRNLADGSQLVAGSRIALGTGQQSQEPAQFNIIPSTVVRAYSEYTSDTGNRYFAANAASQDLAAPRLPQDGGRISLSATGAQLTLSADNRIDAASSGGRAGEFEISANQLWLTRPGSATAPQGFTSVDIGALDGLAAERILIGGQSSFNSATGVQSVTPLAQQVQLAPDQTLRATNVQLTATAAVTLGDRAALESTAPANLQNSQPITLTASGAFVSAGSIRSQVTLPGGALAGQSVFGTGARISAPAAAISAPAGVDSSALGGISVRALDFSTNTLLLGDAMQGLSGSRLTQSTISSLSGASFLRLAASDRIMLTQGIDAGSNAMTELTLVSPLIESLGVQQTSTLQAQRVALQGITPASALSAQAGSNRLVVSGIATRDASGLAVRDSGSIGWSGPQVLSGFDRVDLTAGNTAGGLGGELRFGSSAQIATQALVSAQVTRITGADGSTARIDSTSDIRLSSLGGSLTHLGQAGLGQRLVVSGRDVGIDTRIEAPSGQVHVIGQSVAIGASGSIDAGETSRPLNGSRTIDTVGGRISLQATTGNVTAASGSSLRISDGSLDVRAAQGTADLQASIDGRGRGARQGSVEVDASTIADAAGLGRRASSGGATRELRLRQRSGDLVLSGAGISDTVAQAQDIRLSADAGRVSIDNATVRILGKPAVAAGEPSSAGQLNIFSASRSELGPNTQIDGTNAQGQGASVLLSGSQGVTANGTSAAPVRVDLGGSSGNGAFEVRFPRSVAAGDLAFANTTIANANVLGTSVDTFTGVSDLRLTGTSGGGVLALTGGAAAPLSRAADFMANPGAVATTLGALNPNAQLRPEIEVVAPDLPANPAAGSTVGNMLVSQNIDLATTRFSGGAAGVLTLRAPRDLILSGSSPSTTVPEAVINDGFIGNSFSGNRNTAGNAPFDTTRASHWSYRLAAGANPTVNDPLAVRSGDSRLEISPSATAGAGNVRLVNLRQVRTGSGSIDVAAAGDVLMGTQSVTSTTLATSGSASIFTMGRADTRVFAGFTAPNGAGFPTAQQPSLAPTYTLDGGSISIDAGRDVRSVESGNLVSSWLFRWGQTDAATDTFTNNRNTSWWVRSDLFRQTFGALGGGELEVKAGGSLVNVSASIASSGRLVGATPSVATLVTNGGGLMSVESGVSAQGGSIQSGSFNIMRGEADIRSADGIGSARTASSAPVFPLFGIGDATVQVNSRTAATVDRAYNPTLAPARIGNTGPNAARENNFLAINQITSFSTYSDRSELSVTAASGDLRVVTTTPSALFSQANLLDATNQYQGRDLPFSATPGRLNFNAATGSVRISNAPLSPAGSTVTPVSLYMQTSADGNLGIAARDDVEGNVSLFMGDVDTALGFNVRRPTRAVVGNASWAADYNPRILVRALSPAHATDTESSYVFAGRDVFSTRVATGELFSLNMAEPTQVEAGRDIRNLSFIGQNVRSDSATTIVAGRDVTNAISLDINNQLTRNPAGIELNGPGLVEVRAGRTIGLGTSSGPVGFTGGVLTRGNVNNPGLSEQGASILLVAGLPRNADYSALLNAYVSPVSSTNTERRYDTALVNFVRNELGANAPASLDVQSAWIAFQGLAITRQQAFARTVFFSEIRAGGTGFGDPGSADFRTGARAYRAAQVFFPDDGQGNIDVVFSQVKTERGGQIEVLAPGVVCRTTPDQCSATAASRAVGNVFGGLTSPPAELTSLKSTANLGFLTLGGGSMDFFTGSDIAINQSRAITAGGGSITMFSALGNIDAGRGSRSAVSAPPPQVRVDASGNIVVELPGAVQGSGIGVLVTRPDVPVGDVFLFAPKGFLDAGEAGVRSSGNVVVAANEVRNAANISFGGSSVGVPIAAASVNIGGLSVGASSAATDRAAASAAAEATSQAAGRQRRVLLLVEFLGFGDEGEESFKRRRARAN